MNVQQGGTHGYRSVLKSRTGFLARQMLPDLFVSILWTVLHVVKVNTETGSAPHTK